LSQAQTEPITTLRTGDGDPREVDHPAGRGRSPCRRPMITLRAG